ncbi:probable arabinosyltransferase ARAD1 [Andrographis paniculata]|uniref:probable arabinosyltransferase ARAD1 n=1 Tax=Andrographis paniculata TaxID=175694 RepID=UPI0021E993D4|nr:probable arabinosyltransferase ARAD1 [Andrographis paniculata]
MSLTISLDKNNNVTLLTRLFSYILTFSILLLISSLFSLIKFRENPPIIPKKLLILIGENNTMAPSSTPTRISITGRGMSRVRTPPLPSKNITQEVFYNPCNERQALLRVYMYNLPPKFHFGMLGWSGGANQTWPNLDNPRKIPRYPGGLNLQHSPEYWLTLDLLTSDTDTVVRPCTAVRVHNSRVADIVFVPFFSSLSYNRNPKLRASKQRFNFDRKLQEELVRYLRGREEWGRKRGRDHLIVAHHPNSMLFVRKTLGSSMFLLSDFGRYSKKIANLEKDVIAPYKHMVTTISGANLPAFDQRPTLVYFQGAIYRKDGGVIRQILHNLLKNEKDVHFKYGSVHTNGVSSAAKGMSTSKFCLSIAGDTPSSNRLFDAITSHCIPVIISDEIELPFEDVLDYSNFCIFVRAKDAIKKGFLVNLLRGIPRDEWTKMSELLKNITGRFEYQYPSRPNDAVDMIWQTIVRKKTHTMLNLHRKNRYNRSLKG